MMRLWTWYCKSTIDDETLDLILQVHSDVLVSPLHTIVMSSPHDGELGTGSSPSVQLWLRCFWTSALSALSSGVLSLGTFSSRHYWPLFLILILRGNNQSLLEAVAGREVNNFLIGWSFKSLAVVGWFCGSSQPSETQEWARLNPSPQAIIWVATLPNLDLWSCYKRKH